MNTILLFGLSFSRRVLNALFIIFINYYLSYTCSSIGRTQINCKVESGIEL